MAISTIWRSAIESVADGAAAVDPVAGEDLIELAADQRLGAPPPAETLDERDA